MFDVWTHYVDFPKGVMTRVETSQKLCKLLFLMLKRVIFLQCQRWGFRDTRKAMFLHCLFFAFKIIILFVNELLRYSSDSIN